MVPQSQPRATSTRLKQPTTSSTSYVAFLRGVMPVNCRMADLRASLEAAGFGDVRTVLSSGNVVFSTRKKGSLAALEARVEQAILKGQGRTFESFVRPMEELQALLERDPFARFDLPPETKRVVPFLHERPAPVALPLVLAGARIVAVHGCEVFTTYVRGSATPDFMTLIERSFGKRQTTRTWDTVRKCVAA